MGFSQPLKEIREQVAADENKLTNLRPANGLPINIAALISRFLSFSGKHACVDWFGPPVLTLRSFAVAQEGR